jgi:hypothetical protein
MHDSMDAFELDEQPVFEAQKPMAALYFVSFICLGVLFGVRLFVGIMYDHFARMRQTLKKKSLFTSDEQQKWIDATRAIMEATPPALDFPPTHPVCLWFFTLVQSGGFNLFFMSLIMVNMLVMCTVHYAPSAGYTLAMQRCNLLFTALFAFETSARMIGLGRRQYFRGGIASWNGFDLLLVLVSICDLLIQYSSSGSGADPASDTSDGGYYVNGSSYSGDYNHSSFLGSRSAAGVADAEISASGLLFVTRILRLMRVARLFRLIKYFRGLRLLLLTLVYSLPSLGNIGSLLFLVFFIFAILGVDTFGAIALGGGLTRHANFENFPNAFVTLIRVCTGEAFNDIMFSCANNEGGSTAAFFYFPLFIVLTTFLALNLFVAIMAENFDLLKDVNNPTTLDAQELMHFQQTWLAVGQRKLKQRNADRDQRVAKVLGGKSSTITPKTKPGPNRAKMASPFIRVDDLVEFLRLLEQPLGFGKRVSARKVKRWASAQHLPVFWAYEDMDEVEEGGDQAERAEGATDVQIVLEAPGALVETAEAVPPILTLQPPPSNSHGMHDGFSFSFNRGAAVRKEQTERKQVKTGWVAMRMVLLHCTTHAFAPEGKDDVPPVDSNSNGTVPPASNDGNGKDLTLAGNNDAGEQKQHRHRHHHAHHPKATGPSRSTVSNFVDIEEVQSYLMASVRAEFKQLHHHSADGGEMEVTDTSEYFAAVVLQDWKRRNYKMPTMVEYLLEWFEESRFAMPDALGIMTAAMTD